MFDLTLGRHALSDNSGKQKEIATCTFLEGNNNSWTILAARKSDATFSWSNNNSCTTMSCQVKRKSYARFFLASCRVCVCVCVFFIQSRSY